MVDYWTPPADEPSDLSGRYSVREALQPAHASLSLRSEGGAKSARGANAALLPPRSASPSSKPFLRAW